MKKLTILFLLIATPLFAQNRALRVDSLEVGRTNKNIITDNGTNFLIDPAIATLLSGAGGSVIILTIDGNKTTGNLFRVINDNDGSPGDSSVVVDATGDVGIGTATPAAGSLTLGDKSTSRSLIVTMEKTSIGAATDSSVQVLVDDGNGKIYIKAGNADSLVLTCDADSAKLISNNTISMKTHVTVWGTMSAQVVTDRTDYVNEKKAIEILKDINLGMTTDEFENQDDVFVLPYELRDRQYRSLSRCVSLLLAVAKSQQAEIESLKKQIKKVK